MRIILFLSLIFASVGSFAQGASRRVETLANLLAINPQAMATAGKLTYNVGGYYTNGDWGVDRVADWFPSSSATTNRGNTFAANVSGRWIFRDLADEKQSAKWFGAKGNNSADDTAALQAWLNYCSSNKYEAVLPSGNYRNTGLTVTGDGTLSAFVLSGSVDATLYGTHAGNILYLTNQIRAEIRNVAFYGNGTTASAIYLDNCRRGTIEKCFIWKTGKGIWFNSAVQNWGFTIRENMIEDCTYGIYSDGVSDVAMWVYDNVIEAPTSPTVGVGIWAAVSPSKWVIERNILQTLKDGVNLAGGTVNYANTIKDNYFEEIDQAPIRFGQYGDTVNLSVLNNYFQMSGASTNAIYADGNNLLGFTWEGNHITPDAGNAMNLRNVAYTRGVRIRASPTDHPVNEYLLPTNSLIEFTESSKSRTVQTYSFNTASTNISVDTVPELAFITCTVPLTLTIGQVQPGTPITIANVGTNTIVFDGFTMSAGEWTDFIYREAVGWKRYDGYYTLPHDVTISGSATVGTNLTVAGESYIHYLNVTGDADISGWMSSDKVTTGESFFNAWPKIFGISLYDYLLEKQDVATLGEAIDDRISLTIDAGTGISISYNDAGDSLTISSTFAGTSLGINGTQVSPPNIIDDAYLKWIVSGTNITAYSTNLQYSQIQSVTAERLLGRTSASSGSMQELTAGDGLVISGTVLSTDIVPGSNVTFSTNGSGQITINSSAGAGTNSWQISVDNSLVTTPNLQDSGSIGFMASGTNIQAQIVDGDKGDITVGDVGTTFTIDSGAISYSKIQNVSASKILGRGDSGAGAPQELTVGTGLAITGTTLNATGTNASVIGVDGVAVSGPNLDSDFEITFTPTGSNIVASINANSIDLSRLAQVTSGNGILLGKGTSGSGNVSTVLVGSGFDSSTGTLNISNADKGDITTSSSGNTWTIDSGVVTYDKIQDLSSASVLLGRGTAGGVKTREIALGTGLSMSGNTLNATDASGPTTIFVTTNDSTIYYTTLTNASVLGNVKAGQSKTISGGTMANGDVYKLEVLGNITAPDAWSDTEIYVRFGPNVYTKFTLAESYSYLPTDAPFKIESVLTVKSIGSSASYAFTSTFGMHGEDSNSQPYWYNANVQNIRGTLDTTSAISVDVTLDNIALDGFGRGPITMTCTHAILTKL